MIGISANEQENGTALFVPLTTMHALMTSMPADVNDYWVQTTSHDHAFIDRTTTRIEDTLTTHGYDVNSEIVYVKLADEIASYRTLTTTIAVVGLLDRRDRHGRPGQRTHHERPGTHPRDRHPPLASAPAPATSAASSPPRPSPSPPRAG